MEEQASYPKVYMVAKRENVKQRRSKNERSYTEGRLWGEVRMVKARKSVP